MIAEGPSVELVQSSGTRNKDGRSEQASHERLRQSTSRAGRRVAEYLRALGVSDAEQARALAEEIASSAAVDDEEEHARLAVREAQRRFERWRAAVFTGSFRDPDPLWLRAFIAASPEVFLRDTRKARTAAQHFQRLGGHGRPRAHFSEQKLEPVRVPRWLQGLLPSLLLTGGTSLALLVALGSDGLGALELAWVALFAFLFGVGTVGFFTALRGVSSSSAPELKLEPNAPLPRSALVMPIYHESAERVFANLAAMRDALLSCPGGDAFEIFVLSDSRDPAIAAEEERAFRRVTANQLDSVPIYYRRRAENHRQKAGNLADFFERWGHRYEYAVVLDADSMMTADTLVELLRRMEASPRLGLLQAPIALTGGETLFARALQFAASVSGPLFTRGLARWSGPYGNYYGHNAVIRVRAFLECCALPQLEGEPPFGGHILSHDFVEAALLCRAGWEVRLADDLGGSYEELPPTLAEYVARDRRWCQGNLQHLRVAAAKDLRPMSRLHLLLGVAAYLAGPAWLVFLVLGVALSRNASDAYLEMGGAILAGTAALLLTPRLLALFVTLKQRDARRAHGGVLGLVASLVFELVWAAALAPLLMLHHTRIVLSILLGRTVSWGPQRRRSSGQLSGIVRAELGTTLLGGATAAALLQWAPHLLGWLAPIWLPWSLAIPLATASSSARAGVLLRRLGLLLVPSETRPDPLFDTAERLCALTAGDQAARFRDLVLDPVLVSAHLDRLPRNLARRPSQSLSELRQRALRAGPAALSEAERQALTSDPESVLWLHREAWCHWPIESWEVARECPQLPPESRPTRPSRTPTETETRGSSVPPPQVFEAGLTR